MAFLQGYFAIQKVFFSYHLHYKAYRQYDSIINSLASFFAETSQTVKIVADKRKKMEYKKEELLPYVLIRQKLFL